MPKEICLSLHKVKNNDTELVSIDNAWHPTQM